jgi:glycosyltransferase AglD
LALKLRGALLGAGNIALRGHAPQWASSGLCDEVEIVAVADLSACNREDARAFFPRARAYERAEDLLERESLDFCDICTPPFTHRSLVEESSRRGLHLVCEKPLASSPEDADRIARAVREAGVVFQPCHQYHYSPQWQAVRALLPRIGHVYLAEYEVHRMGANPGNPNWEPQWRTDRSRAGGGILVLHHGYEVEDTAFVTLDFGEGLAQVSLTWAARRREIYYRFVGERGEITGDDERVSLHADTHEEIAFAGGMSQDSSHSEWYAPLLVDFTDRVRRGDVGTEALDEAVYVTRLISRAYESSEQGRALSLTPSEAEEPEAESLAYALATMDAAPDSMLQAPVPAGSSGAPSEGRRRRWVLRGVGLSVLLAAAAWTFYDVDWREVARAVASAQIGWIILAATVNLVFVFAASARWLALVRPMSKVANIFHTFKAMVVGFAVSTVVPARAGELVRAHWLGLDTGLPRTSIIGSIVLDQLVNAAGLLLGLAVLPFFVGVPLWIRPGGAFALALFILGTILVFALQPRGESAPEAAGSPRRHAVARVAAFMAKVRHGLLASREPRALATSFGVSLVAWTLEVNVTALSMKAVGLDLPLSAIFMVLVAVNLALAFPLAPPGNIGTLEISATLALVEFGVPKEQALAFAVVYHLLQVVPIGILGLAFAGGTDWWRPFSRRSR